MNFEVTPKGPQVPPGVNPKFFNSMTIGAGESKKFKTGNVIKVTAGKLRLRNEGESTWTNDNSVYSEKGDIITCTGPVFGLNEEKTDHVSVRVFQKDK